MTDRRLRVAFLTAEYPLAPTNGGIGSYVQVMARALSDLGHDVDVLSFSTAPDHETGDDAVRFISRRALARTPLRHVAGWELADRISAAISPVRMRHELRRYDVIEVADWRAEGLLVPYLTDAAVVAHLHGPLRWVAVHNGRTMTTRERVGDAMERRAVAAADLVTAPSRSLVKALAAEGWLQRPVEVLPHPVDLDRWPVAPPRRRPPVLLSVGRVEPRKGGTFLAATAAALKADAPDIELRFAGAIDEQYAREISEAAARGDVAHQFLGPVSPTELIAHYADAAVVVVPSIAENMGMAGLEAMASARPVITTSINGVADLLDDAHVVRFGDVAGMAAAIWSILRDSAHAEGVGSRNRAVVEQRCASRVVAERRTDQYVRAIEVRAGRRRGHRRGSDAGRSR